MTPRLSALDRFFLALDSPRTPMHIGAIVVLRAGHQNQGDLADAIAARIGQRFATVARLCGYPGRDGRWAPLPRFDPARHVYQHGLPAPGDRATLLREAAMLYSTNLPKDKPLWSVHVVHGLSEQRIALVFTLHHSLFDGVSAIRLLAGLSDQAVAPHAREPRGRSRHSGKAASTLGLARQWFAQPPPIPPLTAFNRPIAGPRHFGVMSLPAAELEDLAKRHHTSVNAVLLSQCGGALRRYLQSQHALPRRSLVALVPIAAHADASAAGNQLSAILCPLATDSASPQARLQLINRSNKRLLRTQAGGGRHALNAIMERLSPSLGVMSTHARIGGWFAGVAPPPCNLAMAHLQGPRENMKIAGADVLHAYPLSSIWHNIGLSVTALRMARQYDIALTGEARMASPIDQIISNWESIHRQWPGR